MQVAYTPVEFTIRGISPLMTHNGQLCDPLNEYAKAMKRISSKRNKTEADYQALADLEWEGGLYLDEKRRVVIPGEIVEGAMNRAAGKMRLKDQCRAGLLCDGNWPLKYDGPKDIDKLKADRRFRDTRKVKIQRNSVMRTRAIFVPWSLTFTVHYLPDMLNQSQVIDILERAGQVCGFGDYLPKYGRFEIVGN